MVRKLNYWGFAMLLLVCPFFASGQSTKVYDEMKSKYPDMFAVLLKHQEHVDISLANGQIKVQESIYRELLHLNEQSNVLAEDEVYTSHFNKLVNLKAATLVPNGKKYRRIEVERYTEKDDNSSGVFYDDSKSTFFVYPALQPGARTIKEYTKEITDPRFLTAFYFGSGLPTEQSQLSIVLDKDIELSYRLMNTDGLAVDFNKEEKNGRVTYTWTASEVEKLQTEPRAPKLSYVAPHIVYHISKATINGQAQAILANVDDLYRMYADFVKEINLEDDPQLRTIVDSLTHNLATEAEKVRAIFYWVQDNIKYIAFENGMRGFIPHSAGLVCNQRYGDCKDMASITQHMLTLAGIKSHLVWVGSRDIPYLYTEVPTPIVDNHMIAAWDNNGQYVFLDATSKYTPMGLPSSMIQGKQALIALDHERYLIEEVPIINAATNVIADTSRLAIVDGSLKGSGTLSLAGYPKVFNSYRIIGLDTKEEADFVTGIVNKGSNKFFVEDYALKNLHDKDKPLQVDYTYKLDDYYRDLGDEIYLNLNLNKSYFNDLIDTAQRQLPLEQEYYHTRNHQVVFELPAGYAVEYLPESSSYSNEVASYTISYQQQGNEIVYSRSIAINYLLLPQSGFQAWNEVIKQLSEQYREVLILKKL